MKTNFFAVAMMTLIAVSTLQPHDAKAGDGDRIRLLSRMTNVGANVGAEGKARWEKRDDGRMKLDVEGRFLSADFGSVDVFLNGEYLTSAAVVLGSFDVDLDTNKGGAVPNVDIGDLIEVIDSKTLDLLFIGNFSNTRGGGGGNGGGNEIELNVELANVGANAIASADARHRTRGSRLRFDVEGEDLSAAFSTVDIFAAGKFVDTVAVDPFGRFVLDLDTFEGDADVPALSDGDLVEVFNADDGSIMFMGFLQTEK